MSDQVLRTLTAHLPGAAYRCANDADWTIEFVSDGILALTGYPATDFIGKSITSYDRVIHPDDRAMVRHGVQVAAKRLQPFQITYRIVTAAGEVRWMWEQGVGVMEGTNARVAVGPGIRSFSADRRADSVSRCGAGAGRGAAGV